MTVGVTGANGFIGRAVCRMLLKRGHAVRGFVRGLERSVPGVDYVLVPNCGPDTQWGAALEGCGAIVHLAARVHVPGRGTPASDALFYDINVGGTERLGRQCVANGVSTFVHLSSMAAVTLTSAVPVDETTMPSPVGHYGRSKLLSEEVVNGVFSGTGSRAVVLRPPMVYGPGAPGNFALLRRAVAWGFPLPFGSIDNRRSFLFVENLVDAIGRCLEVTSARAVYHVSDGGDLSTPDFTRRLARAAGKRPRLVRMPPAILKAIGTLGGFERSVQSLIGTLVVDGARFRSDLAWSPPYSVDEGLARSVATRS